MTNKEICTKAVAAYHIANPDVVVQEWECDPENEGVAILTINGHKVRLKYDPLKGFELLKIHVSSEGIAAGNEIPLAPIVDLPEYKEWSQLEKSGTGALPVLLDILAVVCIIVGIILFSTVSLLWLSYVVGCFAGAVALHITATIIRSMRATQAHAAYIEDLLVHIIANKDK